MFFYKNWKILPISDRNVSLQFSNKVKSPPVRTFEYTCILLQSIFDDMSDLINWKDEDWLYSKEEFSLDNSVLLTSNSWYLNNCTKVISSNVWYLV